VQHLKNDKKGKAGYIVFPKNVNNKGGDCMSDELKNNL
jgi:hypothetical protein